MAGLLADGCRGKGRRSGVQKGLCQIRAGLIKETTSNLYERYEQAEGEGAAEED
jgi:hypothetical protein